MIVNIIKWSLHNRFLVIVAALVLFIAGLLALKDTAVDAIPDLSDVQVIIKTSYPGQAPQVVEDQVTYPLASAMLSVAGAKTVRAFSFFGDSYVYVIFDDDSDIYWARSRVQEYLGQVAASLPESAKPQLGPDATGVGWIYMYALVDRTGQHDLSELRRLQDWFLKFELQAVPGVSEVATVGGMVKQYQVSIDPLKLRAFNIPLAHVIMSIRRGNQEVGASVIEMAEAEYMLRVGGYIKGLQDLENIPLGLAQNGTPILLKHLADIRLGPQMRRGVAELNGEGESVGGIIVMRYGENAAQTIERVKRKLQDLKRSLPEGVELITTYDRSDLINRAVDDLWVKIAEEFAVVAVICALFLFHLRSSLVAIISIPLGILAAIIVMHWQGLNANIMSLGGIAIAIGAMVDGAIVMIENLHRHYEKIPINEKNRWSVVAEAATEVGPALFYSLLIITVSFLPVFTLEAQEGRMFSPLAFTKTYAMAAAAALAITVIPVLMGYFVRGKLNRSHTNPINRFLIYIYRPLLKVVLSYPKSTLVISVLLLASSWYPYQRIGSEFMPDLDEGDLMYMPTTYPGISIGKARELLQQTDKLIKTVPEVEVVFGKVGRAETATDPAPLTMIETFIKLKPKSMWREGITTKDLIAEFDRLVKLPGVSNAWVMPIKTRIDMLATGIKTPVGIKVGGPDLKVIESIGRDLEKILGKVEGTASVYSERVAGGRYLKIDIDRLRAARYGLNIADIQQIISTAVGGMNIAESVEGLERYPINVRYPQPLRDSVQALENLPILGDKAFNLTLGDVASIRVEEGPPGIKSENARPNGWTFVDIEGIDVGTYVAMAQERVSQQLDLPAGYSLNWAGQFEYMQRAQEKLSLIVPLTLLIIVVLLYLNFQALMPVLMVLLCLPFALIGGLWLMHFEGFNFSIAVGVGFIALIGVAVETNVIMLVYLENRFQDHTKEEKALTSESLAELVIEAALTRIRPLMMTSLTIIIGLIPVLYGTGTGSSLTSRIAAPMVGGMFSALLLSLFVLPTMYFLWRKKLLK